MDKSSMKKKNAGVPFQIVTRQASCKSLSTPLSITSTAERRTCRLVLKKLSPNTLKKYPCKGLTPPEPKSTVNTDGQKSKSFISGEHLSEKSTPKDIIDSNNPTACSASTPLKQQKLNKKSGQCASVFKKVKCINKKGRPKALFCGNSSCAKTQINKKKSPSLKKGNKPYSGTKEQTKMSIASLEKQLKELLENDTATKKRLSIFEKYYLPYLQREEENKMLLEKKEAFKIKLEHFNDEEKNVENQKKELQTLKEKKDCLLEKVKAKKEELTDMPTEEKMQLLISQAKKRRLNNMEETKYLKKTISELEEKSVILPHEILHPPLFGFLIRDNEQPEENKKQKQLVCQVCVNLRKERNSAKKELDELRLLSKELQKELEDCFIEYSDLYCLNSIHKAEIEYFKKRTYNQRLYHSPYDETRQIACSNDDSDRWDYTEKICKVLDKNLHTKKVMHTVYPRQTGALPLSTSHRERNERLAREGKECCCEFFPQFCQRYLCGRKHEGKTVHYEHLTGENLLKFEKTMGKTFPGWIKTEEGMLYYIRSKLRGCANYPTGS